MFRQVLAALLVFAFGFLGGIIFSPEGDLASTFFDFKLIDVFNALVTLTVAYWITYQISKRLGNESKLREILSMQVEAYQLRILGLHEQAIAFKEGRDPAKVREINANFKVLSNLLGTLCLSKDKCKMTIHTDIENGKLKRDYFILKAAMTDRFFTVSDNNEMKIVFSDIEFAHNQAINTLVELKLGVYS